MDDQAPTQDLSATPPAGPDLKSNLIQALDTNPELQQHLQTTFSTPSVDGESEAPTEGPKAQTSLWRQVASSIGRGAVKAVQEGTRSVVAAGVGLSKATGLYKLGRTPEEQDAFLKWYEKPSKDWEAHVDLPGGAQLTILDPVVKEDRNLTKWMGPARGGIMGFIEGASQFATGMAITAKLLKPYEAFQALPAVTKAATEGLLVDTTMFDTYQKRLSNMVQDGPEWLKNPITEALQAKEDDPEPLARMKAGLEGMVTGVVAEQLVSGIKAVRAKMAVESGKMSTQEANAVILKSMKEAEDARLNPKPQAGEVVTVAETPEGKFEVRDASGTPAKDAQTLVPGAEKVEHLDAPPAGLAAQEALVSEDGSGGFVGRLKYTTPEGGSAIAYFPLKTEADAARFGKARGKADLTWGGEDLLRKASSEKPGEWMQKLMTGEGEPVVERTLKTPQAPAEATAVGRTPRPKAEAPVAPVEPPAPPVLDEPSGKVSVVYSKEKNVDLSQLPSAVPTGTETGAAVPTFVSRGEAEQVAATINFAHKNAIRAPLLSKEEVRGWQDAMIHYAKTKDPRSTAELLESYGINFKYAQQPKEVVDTIKSLVDNMPTSLMTRDRPRTWAEVSKDADGIIAGMSGDELASFAAQVFGDTSKLDAYITVLRTWTFVQARNVQKLSQMVEANPKNAVAMDQLAASLDTLHNLQAHLSGTSSNVGRALNSEKMPLGEAVQALYEAKEATQAAGHRAPPGRAVTEGMTKDEIRALARAVHLADGDPEVISKIINGPKMTPKIAANPELAQKWWSYIQSYRIEAMLSGPKTHLTNSINNALVAFQRPMEYWWAGVRSSNPELRQSGADMLVGLLQNLRDSWSVAKKSYLDGSNILDPGTTVADSGSAMGQWGQVSWLPKLLKANSRFLMSADELFKQLNYRANMRAQILRLARSEGITDSAELARRLTEDMKVAFDPNGGAVNPTALQYARVSTFTNELDYGIGKWLQEGAQEHPSFRLIMPFIRSPVNIFRYAWQRTPILNRLNREFAADLAAGGERAAIAQAKSEMGLAVWGSAAGLAMSGQITGRGPSDPELRQQWIQAGHQPYSFKIPGTDKWMSYRRGDPVFTALGLVADAVAMSGEMDQESHTNTIAAVAASIAANVSSKTFMQGITEFMDAASSGRADVAEKFGQNMVASFIPNVLRQANPDDTLRETRTMVDELMARLPGFSTSLEPRRNIFGEKVMRPPGYINNTFNPFTVMTAPKDGNVQDELVKVGRAFSMPAEKRFRGLLDLTDRATFGADRKGQSPYDRMLEIMSEPIIGRKTLREQMERLVESPAWKNSPGEDAYGPGGLKHQLANDLLQSYQNAAFERVLNEYPTLKKAYKQATELQGAGMARGTEGVTNVMQKYEQMFVQPRGQ